MDIYEVACLLRVLLLYHGLLGFKYVQVLYTFNKICITLRALLVGLEFVMDRNSRTPFERKSDLARTVTGKAFERGLIVHPVFGGIDSVYGDCILLAPPFIIQEKEIDEIVGILAQTLGDIESILR